MSDEIKQLLNSILPKVDSALASLKKFEDRNSSHKECNELRDIWNRLRQINHAIKEHEGFEVERTVHTKVPDNSALFDKEETHESFGVLAVTNVVGKMRLVGTTTDSLPNSVRMTFHRSRRLIDSNTHSEYYMNKGPPLLQIEMSRNQWAEAICGMNGVGVPVTVRTVMGTRMEDVPKSVTSPFQQIINDANKKLNYKTKSTEKFKEDVDKVITTINDMKLPKTKASTIQKYVHNLYDDHIEAVAAQSAWASERLAEEAEKAVNQAKIEVAGSINSLINEAGMKALGIDNSIPQLRGIDPSVEE